MQCLAGWFFFFISGKHRGWLNRCLLLQVSPRAVPSQAASPLCCLLPAHGANISAAPGEPSGEQLSPQLLTPGVWGWVTSALASHRPAGSGSSRAATADAACPVLAMDFAIPAQPFIQIIRAWFLCRASGSPSPAGLPELLPCLQKHHRLTPNAINRTKFAIKSMKFYLATPGKHLWHA